MKRLTNPEEVEDARPRIAELLDARGEWFVREGRDGAAVELRGGEWELRASAGALVLSYWGVADARASRRQRRSSPQARKSRRVFSPRRSFGTRASEKRLARRARRNSGSSRRRNSQPRSSSVCRFCARACAPSSRSLKLTKS